MREKTKNVVILDKTEHGLKLESLFGSENEV
jgi:hypothetical protein